tara:strand:+ start:6137 stop:10963 length:4827 start_codon:yes stop_codon:yes gene_type:complete
MMQQTKSQEYTNNTFTFRRQISDSGARCDERTIDLNTTTELNTLLKKINVSKMKPTEKYNNNNMEIVRVNDPVKLHIDLDIKEDDDRIKIKDIIILKQCIFVIIQAFIKNNDVKFKDRDGEEIKFTLNDVVVLTNEYYKYPKKNETLKAKIKKDVDSIHIIINKLLFKNLNTCKYFLDYIITELKQFQSELINYFPITNGSKRKSKTSIKIQNIILDKYIDNSIYDIKVDGGTRNFRLIHNSKSGNFNHLINLEITQKETDKIYEELPKLFKTFGEGFGLNQSTYTQYFQLKNVKDSLITWNENVIITQYKNSLLDDIVPPTKITIKKINKKPRYSINNMVDAINYFILYVGSEFWNSTNKTDWDAFHFIIGNYYLPNKKSLEFANVISKLNETFNKLSNDNGGTGSFNNVTPLTTFKKRKDNEKKYGFTKLNDIYSTYTKGDTLIFNNSYDGYDADDTDDATNDNIINSPIDKYNDHYLFIADFTKLDIDAVIIGFKRYLSVLKEFKNVTTKAKLIFDGLEVPDFLQFTITKEEFKSKYQTFNKKFILFKNGKDTYLYSKHTGKISKNAVLNTRSNSIFTEEETSFLTLYRIIHLQEKANDLKKHDKIVFNFENLNDKKCIQNGTPINKSIQQLIKEFLVIFTKIQMGGGKTSGIVMPFLENNLNDKEVSAVFLTPINSLNSKLKEECKQFNFLSHQDIQTGLITHGEFNQSNRVVVSIESMVKTTKKFNIVILDELTTLLNHFNSSTITSPTETFNKFKTILQNANKIICLDADINSTNIDCINSILSGSTFDKSRDSAIIRVYPTKYKDRPVNIFSNKQQFKNLLYKDINNEKSIYYASTTFKHAEERHNIIINDIETNKLQFKTGGIIFVSVNGINYTEFKDSKVIRQFYLDKDKFIGNINEELKKYNIRICITTPSIKVGISIDTRHFDEIYGFGNSNSITSREFFQMLLRQRKGDNLKILFSVNDYTSTDNIIYKHDIKKSLELPYNLLNHNQLLKNDKYNYNNTYNIENKDIDFLTIQMESIAESKISQENYFKEMLIGVSIKENLKINFVPINLEDTDKKNNINRDKIITELINYNKFIEAKMPNEINFIEYTSLMKQKKYLEAEKLLTKNDLTKDSIFKYRTFNLYQIPKNKAHDNDIFITEPIFKTLTNKKNVNKFYNISKLPSRVNNFIKYESKNKHSLFNENKNKDDVRAILVIKILKELMEYKDIPTVLSKIDNKDKCNISKLLKNFQKLDEIEINTFINMTNYPKISNDKSKISKLTTTNISIELVIILLNNYLSDIFLMIDENILTPTPSFYKSVGQIINYPTKINIINTKENFITDETTTTETTTDETTTETTTETTSEDNDFVSKYITEWYIKNTSDITTILTNTDTSKKHTAIQINFKKFIINNIFKEYSSPKIYTHPTTINPNIKFYDTFKLKTDDNFTSLIFSEYDEILKDILYKKVSYKHIPFIPTKNTLEKPSDMIEYQIRYELYIKDEPINNAITEYDEFFQNIYYKELEKDIENADITKINNGKTDEPKIYKNKFTDIIYNTDQIIKDLKEYIKSPDYLNRGIKNTDNLHLSTMDLLSQMNNLPTEINYKYMQLKNSDINIPIF